jgi:hypothetical protein
MNTRQVVTDNDKSITNNKPHIRVSWNNKPHYIHCEKPKFIIIVNQTKLWKIN